MTLLRRGVIASLASLLGGCSPVAALNSTVPRRGYTLEAGIPYGPASRQKLDFYRPEKPRPDGKTVLFLYGGSWDSGSKDDYLFVAQALASRGFGVVVPDYRLYPEVRFPTFLDDAALATRLAADRFGVDKLFLMGHSAGAHMALMLATNTPYLARAGVDRMRLRGVAGLAGPYDFLPLTSQKLIEVFGGASHPETQPITFATAPLPPLLLLHGESDSTVFIRNSERLAAAWRRAGAAVEFKRYASVGHIAIITAFSDFLQGSAPSRDDTLAWLAAT